VGGPGHGGDRQAGSHETARPSSIRHGRDCCRSSRRSARVSTGRLARAALNRTTARRGPLHQPDVTAYIGGKPDLRALRALCGTFDPRDHTIRTTEAESVAAVGRVAH